MCHKPILFIPLIDLFGIVHNQTYGKNDRKKQKRYTGKKRASGLVTVAVWAESKLVWAKWTKGLQAGKAIFVDDLLIMLQRLLCLILIYSVMIKAIARSASVAERIDKIAFEVDLIQDIGCKTEKGRGGGEGRRKTNE